MRTLPEFHDAQGAIRRREPHQRKSDAANVFVTRANAQRSRLLFPENGPRPGPMAIFRRAFLISETVRHRGPDGNASAAPTGDQVIISPTCGGGATPLPRTVSPARRAQGHQDSDRTTRART